MGVPRFDWLDASRLAPYDVLSSGWEALLRNLFAEIDGLIAGSGAGMRLFQAKEKFGALRMYYRLDNATPLLAIQVAAVVCKSRERQLSDLLHMRWVRFAPLAWRMGRADVRQACGS